MRRMDVRIMVLWDVTPCSLKNFYFILAQPDFQILILYASVFKRVTEEYHEIFMYQIMTCYICYYHVLWSYRYHQKNTNYDVLILEWCVAVGRIWEASSTAISSIHRTSFRDISDYPPPCIKTHPKNIFKKFFVLYGTPVFITLLKTASRRSLSQATHLTHP